MASSRNDGYISIIDTLRILGTGATIVSCIITNKPDPRSFSWSKREYGWVSDY